MNKSPFRALKYISQVLNPSREVTLTPSWPELLEVSEKEGLSAFLYIAMTRKGIEIPLQFRERFKREYISNWRRNTPVFGELSELLPVLERPVILLKGASLLPTAYKNYGLRSMEDVDMLVRREDAPQINRTLFRLGYRTDIELSSYPVTNYLNSLMYRKKGSPLLLHLHWHIINTIIPNYVCTEKINLGRLWEEAVPIRVRDTNALCLAPHHQLLHLSEHALKHSYRPLQVVLDIHQWLNYRGGDMDWKRLCKEAEEFRLRSPLFYGLWLSREIFNTKVPEEVVEALRPPHPGLAEKTFFRLLLRGKRPAILGWLFYLSQTPGWRKRTEFLFHTVFPPPETLRLIEGVDNKNLYSLYWGSFLRRLQGRL